MHRCLALLTLFLASPALLADEADEALKKELKKLEGTWTTAALTYNGKDNSKFNLRFTIKGDEVAIEGNDQVKKEYAKLRLKLMPGVSPKQVDITVTGGVQLDAAIEGIYELKDDEFKICAKVFGLERPTAFASPEGSSIALLVLKREKP
jgi:uncharacterized protein (TIGR03067 family)